MMYDLTGYMVINGKDAWTEYSAFLCEDRPEDSTNVTELLKPPEMKEYTAVDFRERNGEELPQQLPLPRCKPRDLTPVSYTHLRAHETGRKLVCRLLLEKKNSYDVFCLKKKKYNRR